MAKDEYLVIVDYELEDIGVEGEQYFQGRGVSHSKWDEVFTGIGNSYQEALRDAASQLWDFGVEGSNDQADKLDDEISRASKKVPKELADAEEGSELHYYAAISVKLKDTNPDNQGENMSQVEKLIALTQAVTEAKQVPISGIDDIKASDNVIYKEGTAHAGMMGFVVNIHKASASVDLKFGKATRMEVPITDLLKVVDTAAMAK